MSAAFNRAAIEQKFTVLGRSLKPFSIGHEILLRAGGSAFSIEAETQPEDLFPDLTLAIRICSKSYRGAIQDITGGDRAFRLWLFYLRHVPFNKETEILKFWAYLSYYRSGPEYTRKEDIARTAVGTPFEYTLKVFLCTKMGLTVEQAMNYPYCTAKADYLAYLESKGALHVVSSVEEVTREAMELHKKVMERM